MVKPNRKKGAGKAPGKAPGGNKPNANAKKGKPGQQGKPASKRLTSAKGTFVFTMVTDGCYIEHQWGNNSGHIGIPLKSIPGFVGMLTALHGQVVGKSVKKAAGAKSKGVVKKGKKDKKGKKEPAPKPTTDDLDADLASYTAAREGGAAEAAPVEDAAMS